MTWFIFCYWYEPDAPEDPVGLIRIWQLADQLHSLGDDVTVLAPDYASARRPRRFVTVPIRIARRAFWRPLSYALGSFTAGWRLARRRRPAVIYYRWMASPHVWVLAMLWSSRCVCEINGEPVPEWTQEGAFLRWFRHRLARFVLSRCERVVVLTDGLRDIVMNRYAVPRERIIYSPSGTDLDLFAPKDRRSCREKTGLPAEKEYIGFVGSFYRYQGLEVLLDALRLILDVRPNVQLLLVGDGEMAQPLRDRAVRIGIASSIAWTGRVPYEQVPIWIGAMDVCAAPFASGRGETSPVKVLDYLACGRPVVASAIPSIEGMFSESNGVVLCRADDPESLAQSILTVLRASDYGAILGQKGRQFMERQGGWAAIVRRIKDEISAVSPGGAHAHFGVL
jgi:glycosyltransferase involved in cell wall biosynthesis